MSEHIADEKAVPETISQTHMNVTVDFSLLSAQLCGAIEKNENGVEFLVMPQQSGVSNDHPLNSTVDGINELFVKMTESDEFKLNAADIFEKIKTVVGDIVLEALKVSIKQVFIHLVKPKEGKAKLEYAFSVGINLADDKASSDTSYTKLQSMTFGIWNTDNKKIIEKMGLLDISEQLV